MRIGTDVEHVDLVVLERSESSIATRGDVRIKVTVTLRDFSGAYDSVYLDQSTLAGFLEAITDMERTRSGSAELKSMSPNEFSLQVRSRDSLGHFVVEVALQRFQYSGPTYWPTTVSGGFELDPTELPRLAQQFRALIDG